MNSSGAQLAISKKGSLNNESLNATLAAGTYYAQVFAAANVWNATNCYTLQVQTGTAGTQEISTTPSDITVNVFPNPVQDKVNIYLLGDNARKQMIVTDARGRTIYQQQVTDMITTLDMQKLPAGVYVIKIVNAEGKILFSEKVVKN